MGLLPAGQYQALRHLVAHGWSGKVAEVQQGLGTALEKQPPAADVRTTAEGLFKSLGEGDAEVVSVTDGLSADESD